MRRGGKAHGEGGGTLGGADCFVGLYLRLEKRKGNLLEEAWRSLMSLQSASRIGLRTMLSVEKERGEKLMQETFLREND